MRLARMAAVMCVSVMLGACNVTSSDHPRKSGAMDDKMSKRAVATTALGWDRNGGNDLLESFALDTQAIYATSTTASRSGLLKACTDLRTDALTGQRYDPMPNRAAQADWAKALAEYLVASGDCVAAVRRDETDTTLLGRAAAEIARGKAAVNKATSALVSGAAG